MLEIQPWGSDWTISESNLWYKGLFVLKTIVLLVQIQIYSYMAGFRINWEIDSNLMTISDIFEVFFLIDIGLKFFRQFTPF